ncbi:MAG: acyloxyacyl hydrolase [Maribacter sp.]|nr:acyloxyacyl hydrolase [Maribacter sp.]NNK18680.1 hypothetical protein [Maribacter sp.]
MGVFLYAPENAMAQDSNDSLNSVKLVGLKFHLGSVLIHSKELRPIKDSYPTGVEFDLAWHKISQKAWESCMCYPKLGVALTSWGFDNKEVLGQGITGLFYIEPVFNTKGRVNYSVRAGLGLSYQNSPYDPVSNPDNQSYSTYIGFPLQLGGTVHFRIKNRWLLNGSLVYNHISNGGVSQPNKGINWPSLGVGMAYYLKEFEFKKRADNNWRDMGPPKKRFDFTFFMAYEEPRDNLFLLSPGLEIKWSRQFARLNAYTFGGEVMYDNGTGYLLEQLGDEGSSVKAGIAFGHEFLLGKFLFSQQFGVYLSNPNPMHTDVYQRYGLVYRINKNFNTGFSLKAHGHVANFLDLRVGISL